MMTNEQANRVLDRVRDGDDITEACISIALRVTGDLGVYEGLRGEGVDYSFSKERQGLRCAGGKELVD